MIRRSTRTSGCQVVTEVIPGARSVALGVMVAAGSRFERDDQQGASHLLEHLLFRGSEAHDGREIADLLDRLGGDSNAYTDKEVMTAYVRTLPERTTEALDLLTSVISSPTLDPGAVRSELAVVADEILARDDEPADIAGTVFEELCFPGHPLGRDVLGTEATLRALDADAVRGYHAATYGTGRMAVLAVGAVDHDEIVSLADELVRPRSADPAIRSTPELPVAGVRVIEQAGGQAHVVLGTPFGPLEPRDRATLAILSHLLGGGVSSRLFREVREERGLAYGVGTELSLYAGAGSVSAYAASAPDATAEVIDLLVRAFDEAGAGGVGDDEVDRSIEALRTDLLLSADEPLTRLGRLGADALLSDTVVETSERVDLLASVRGDEVRAMAERIASGPRVATLVGPARPAAVAALDRAVGR
jgi:predicted Zn-dependent peptidase